MGTRSQMQRFEAVLESGDRALGWTIARVSFDPAAMWKTMLRLRVQGTIAARMGQPFPFRTSLFADPRGGYYLLVNRAMQQAAGVGLGAKASFTLEPDLEPRPAELPEELDLLLDDEPGLRQWYDALSEYTRREIGKWVQDVKSDAARIRRAEQMALRLASTMEAERELPPAIARALRQSARVQAGWNAMTPTQRRMELFAVHYYQTPDAQEKRIAKLCEAAAKRAPKG
jgi:uncharacterized protein YdeI (YjbR/CyaY-like superfamily)